MAIEVKSGMTLLDAAAASAGSAEDFFSFVLLNGLSFTDDIAPGTVLQTTGKTYKASLPPNNDHITVKAILIFPGQTLADMAIQQLGSVEAIFALANLNGLSISDEIMPGQTLNYSLTPYDKNVYKLYQDKKLKPASAVSKPGQETPVDLEGIGYWIIQKDFIVS